MDPSRPVPDAILARLANSQTLRLLTLGFLVVLLQIPIFMIDGLVRERRDRRDEATAEVSSKWGSHQHLLGPVLVLPYTHRWTETAADRPATTRMETRNAYFLPDDLEIQGGLEKETRARGIFSVPVYRLRVSLAGNFGRTDLAELGIDAKDVAWDRAHLAVGVSDIPAIEEQPTLTWNGKPYGFQPGLGGFQDAAEGIHAPIAATAATDGYRFELPLVLRGSVGMYFAPFGRQTAVALESNASSPSFQGKWLPADRSVSADGFQARWSVPFLGRNYPQVWTSVVSHKEEVAGSTFGVELVDPVDQYRMAERSTKYAALFLLFTFALIWLIEVVTGHRVHVIQYLLLGSAMCLFFLLELSLSEHLGFGLAYALAASLVVAQIGCYAWVALRRVSRALAVAGGVAALYAYLFVVLTNEDYALLIGALGLFGMLGAIMYFTRRVDWHGAGRPERAASGA